MLTYLNRTRAQSTLEYAVLIVIIIGALLSIQFYLKRGIQGRLKSSADDIGDQYSVGNTNVLKTVKTHAKTRDTFASGVTNSALAEAETTNTTENSVIVDTQKEDMGRTK